MKQVLYLILAGLTVIGAAYPQSEVPRLVGVSGPVLPPRSMARDTALTTAGTPAQAWVLTFRVISVSRGSFSSTISM
jgi:hypothetical protein